MKISTRWLENYVDHGLTIDELADRLTMCGLEVESVSKIGGSLNGVVVGKVLDVSAHPNADRLTVCNVDIGADEMLSIVCGAPNVAKDQHVPVAMVGTTLQLPDRSDPSKKVPIKIKQAKLRGVVSSGMICAEDELGLSDDHSGIMVLDEDSKIGQPLFDYLGDRGIPTDDAVMDIAITPNRPDATSHIGVARDVSAISKRQLDLPPVALPPTGGDAAREIAVEIQSPEGCGRYSGVVIKDVTVTRSPAWLQARLRAVGLRPRNNVVDVTNFVMMEYGQPLHAFDLDQIAQRRIVVKKTKTESAFTTLDSKDRKLPVGTLMICDGERPIAIAGVMGGENSEVSESTRRILIESAYFDPSSIRRTSKLLGLQTDASYRFERGVDPEGQARAAMRAAIMIAELGKGSLVEGIVDARPVKLGPCVVDLRLKRTELLLGTPVPPERIVRLLTSIGFEVTPRNSDVFRCVVPTFRPDVTREIDVIEEVARLFGYDNIPLPERTVIPDFTPRERPQDTMRIRASQILRGAGFREAYTNSLLAKDVATAVNYVAISTISGEVVQTENAINTEMSALRPNVLSTILPSVVHNVNHGQSIVRMFEFGNVFVQNDDGDNVIPGYSEHTSLATISSGVRGNRSFDEPARETDYYDLKGVVESAIDHLGLACVFGGDPACPVAEFGELITVADETVGVVAKLSQATAATVGLEQDTYFAEMNWSRLVALAPSQQGRQFQTISRYPVVDRDLAVVVDEDQPVGALLTALRIAGGDLVHDLDLFDLYRGKGILPGKKSCAFGVRFAADRTLTDGEVDRALRQMIKALERQFDAELRS